MVKPAGAKPCHLLIERCDDAGDLALRDPRASEGCCEIVDLAVLTPWT